MIFCEYFLYSDQRSRQGPTLWQPLSCETLHGETLSWCHSVWLHTAGLQDTWAHWVSMSERTVLMLPRCTLSWMCLIIQMQNCMLIMLFRSSLSPPIASYFLFLFLFYPPSQPPELWLAQLIPFTKVLTFKGGKQLVIPPDCRNLTNDWRSPLRIS